MSDVEDDFDRDTDYIEDRVTRRPRLAGLRTATGSSSSGLPAGPTIIVRRLLGLEGRAGMGVCRPTPTAQLDLRPRPDGRDPVHRHGAAA